MNTIIQAVELTIGAHNIMNKNYKVVKDGDLWGVLDRENDALVNPEPMLKIEANELAAACNCNLGHDITINPEWDK